MVLPLFMTTLGALMVVPARVVISSGMLSMGYLPSTTWPLITSAMLSSFISSSLVTPCALAYTPKASSEGAKTVYSLQPSPSFMRRSWSPTLEMPVVIIMQSPFLVSCPKSVLPKSLAPSSPPFPPPLMAERATTGGPRRPRCGRRRCEPGCGQPSLSLSLSLLALLLPPRGGRDRRGPLRHQGRREGRGGGRQGLRQDALRAAHQERGLHDDHHRHL